MTYLVPRRALVTEWSTLGIRVSRVDWKEAVASRAMVVMGSLSGRAMKLRFLNTAAKTSGHEEEEAMGRASSVVY